VLGSEGVGRESSKEHRLAHLGHGLTAQSIVPPDMHTRVRSPVGNTSATWEAGQSGYIHQVDGFKSRASPSPTHFFFFYLGQYFPVTSYNGESLDALAASIIHP
jgi:hypothetical protein